MLSSKAITRGFNPRVKEKAPKGSRIGNLAGASCNARRNFDESRLQSLRVGSCLLLRGLLESDVLTGVFGV
jgi:hypothetical protein